MSKLSTTLVNFGQETIHYLDRKAELIINHPFVTQVDFFDMQEDQESNWEAVTRQHEAERVADETGLSAAQVSAAPVREQPDPAAFASTAGPNHRLTRSKIVIGPDNGPRFFEISDEHQKSLKR